MLASILVPRLLVDIGWRDALLLVVLIAAAFGARVLALFILVPPLERFGLTQRISASYKLAIIWGGLRGALTLVLALAVTENAALPPQVQRFVAVLATGFVLFTLFVNGTTLRLVIGLLGLDRLSARDAALRDRILALSYAEASAAAHEIARAHGLSRPAVERGDAILRGEGAAGETADAARPPDRTRPPGDRAGRARPIRSASSSSRCASDRVASPAAVQVLLGNCRRVGRGGAERRPPRVSPRRRSGARAAARLPDGLFSLPPPRDRPAYWPTRLADRLEMLLVMRFVIERLRSLQAAADRGLLFGERIAGHHRRDHRSATRRDRRRARCAAAAIPGLCGRDRGALSPPIDAAPGNDAIPEPVRRGADLARGLRGFAARRARRSQPPTGARGSISASTRISWSSGSTSWPGSTSDQLDRGVPAAAAALRLARTSGSCAKAARANAVFFIASGAVEVLLPERRVRLGDGEFFGEMALLVGSAAAGRCRRSDVLSAAGLAAQRSRTLHAGKPAGEGYDQPRRRSPPGDERRRRRRSSRRAGGPIAQRDVSRPKVRPDTGSHAADTSRTGREPHPSPAASPWPCRPPRPSARRGNRSAPWRRAAARSNWS